MAKPLPQQTLLLELISMSGDIAVPSEDDGTLLFRTLGECKAASWIRLTPFGQGFDKASLTAFGRKILKELMAT